jgi:branched-chain amino acid transport system substrate-binding protein
MVMLKPFCGLSGGKSKKMGVHMILKRLAVLGAVLIPAVTITGMSSAGPSSASTPSTYTIGFSSDLSGPTAPYGKSELQVLNAVVSQVNSGGGVNGHKLKVVSLDEQFEPTLAAQNAKQLVGDNPILIMGFNDSGTCGAAYAVTKPAAIPLECATAPSEDISPAQPFLFTQFATEALYAKGSTQYFTTLPGGKPPKLGLLPLAIPGTLAWATAFAKTAKAAGGSSITAQVPVASSTDQSSETAVVLAAHPTAVIGESVTGTSIATLKQLRTGGFTGSLESMVSDYVLMSTTKDPKVITPWDTAVINPSSKSPGVSQLVKTLGTQGLTGATALNSYLIPANYLGDMQAIKALKACPGTCTPAALAKEIAKTSLNIPGVSLSSGFGYTTTRHYPVTQFALYAWSTSANAPVIVATKPVG